jgi:hypothetical protein
MKLPENWTLSRLREELTEIHIPFSKTDKKSVLVKKFKERDQIQSGSNASSDVNQIQGFVQSVSALTHTVAQLQKRV